MIAVDYIVITSIINDKIEAQFPSIVGQYVSKPKEERIMQYYGFKGENNVFVGKSNDRIMIWASGSNSHYIAKTLNVGILEDYSVARIDLQITVTSLDADYWIEHIQPSKIYKSIKISNIHEKGTTLYVGSPNSNLRLRIYNKTAESGIAPDAGGEYVRFELQCRNNYADKAFVAFRNNMIRSFYTMILKRMVDTYTYNLIYNAIQSSEEELFFDSFPSSRDEPIARKKRWLEQSVLPALRRLLLEDKEYVDYFIGLLYNYNEDNKGTNMY